MSARHLTLLAVLVAAALALPGCDDDGGGGGDTTTTDTDTSADTGAEDTSTDDDTAADTQTNDVCGSDACGPVDTTPDDTAIDDTSSDTSTSDTSVDDTSGGDTAEDTSDVGDMTDEDMTQADTIAESTDPAQEFPDCVAGCTHDGPAFTTPWDRYTAIYGIIDDQCHSLAGVAQAPDIDVIEITAPARTLLEFQVAPTAGSIIDPLVTTSDGFALLTYNDAGGIGGTSARTVLASPYVTGLPFYVVVEHAPNYFAFDPTGTCALYTGGSDHEYELTINELPFVPIEAGTLTAGGSATVSGTLEAAGDIAHVRFMAPADSTPTVTVTNTGAAAFTPSVAGMNTIQGQLVWNAARVATGTSVQLTQADFDVCDSGCDAVTGEFVLAIVDYEGLGGSAYTFDVEIQL